MFNPNTNLKCVVPVRSLVLTLLLFLVLPSPAALMAEPAADYPLPLEPLHLFYGGKLGFSFLLAGTAVTDPEAEPRERAIAGGASLLLALPSSAVWYHSRRGNTQALRRWRIISFATDLTLSGGLTGYGAYLMSTGDTTDQWAGISAFSVGVLSAMLSSLNLRPFQVETGL